MASRSRTPTPDPFVPAYDAADLCVEETVHLYLTISAWESPDSVGSDQANHESSAVVAHQVVDLWNKIPEYRAKIHAVAARLSANDQGSIEGWQGVGYSNAHEACLGMATNFCEWLLETAFCQRPSLIKKGGQLTVTNEVIDSFTRHRSEITNYITFLPSARQIGNNLLAVARIERDRALKAANLDTTGPPREGAPNTESPGRTQEKPISPEEANVMVRRHLQKNPSATARETANAVGIALGRVSGLSAWQAHQASKKAETKPKAARQERPLTKRMLEVIGKDADPSERIEAQEAAWQYLLNKATPDERARLHSLKPAEKAEHIRLVIEQAADQFDVEE